MSLFRRTSFLIFALFLLPLAGAAQEPTSQKVNMSAQVVKAEFSETIWAIAEDETADGQYRLSIFVPNTGSLEATDVAVTVSTLEDWEIISMEPAEYAIALVDKSPYNRIRWTVPKIDIGGSVELSAVFSLKRQVQAVPVEVLVESAVSAPIEIGTDVDGGSSSLSLDENDLSTTRSDAWLARFLAWLRGLFDAVAAWLNDLYDRYLL